MRRRSGTLSPLRASARSHLLKLGMATSKPQFFDTADPESMLPPALEAQWSADGVPLPPVPNLRRLPSPAPHRILVKAVNWLGDLVMSGPALHAIHDMFPGAHLSVLVRRDLASFFDGALWVDEVIPYRLRGGVAGLLDQFSIIKLIRAGRFDLAVVFPSSFQSALWVTLAGVQRRAGYVADRRGFMLTHKVAPRADVEHLQRFRFGAVEARRRHHHRGGVEPALRHKLADGFADRGRDAVIVGAQPDRPKRGGGAAHSAAVRAGASARAWSVTPWAVRTLCSATK